MRRKQRGIGSWLTITVLSGVLLILLTCTLFLFIRNHELFVKMEKRNQIVQDISRGTGSEKDSEAFISSKYIGKTRWIVVDGSINTSNIDDINPVTSKKNNTVNSGSVENSGIGKIHTKNFDNNIIDNLLEDTVLLIIASNRPQYLKQCLERVVKYAPNNMSIVVSEDGKDQRVREVVEEAGKKLQTRRSFFLNFQHLHHEMSNMRYENGYFKLSAHFKWALQKVFSNDNVDRVIILEEDLLISEDFFNYFAAVSHILDTDKKVLAASAWNDNGGKTKVKDEKALYRSDFFPGLGWMMHRQVWNELKVKWPRAYWDDWLREPQNRKGRVTIRPEICRTLHIGARGVSNAQYSSYLNSIHLNDRPVNFAKLDLGYLQSKESWDAFYLDSARKAKLVSIENFKSSLNFVKRQGKEAMEIGIRLVYGPFEHDRNSFSEVARLTGAMDNVKANVPRTAYRGIVSLWYEDVKVFLVHESFR